MRERKRTSEKLHTVRRVLWWIVAVPERLPGLLDNKIAHCICIIPFKTSSATLVTYENISFFRTAPMIIGFFVIFTKHNC